MVFLLETTEQRRSDAWKVPPKSASGSLKKKKKDDDVVEFVEGFVAEFIEESA